MTTPTTLTFVYVASSIHLISIVALTNDCSTHLNADNYLLWRDQITPLLICNDLNDHLQKPSLLTDLAIGVTLLKGLVKENIYQILVHELSYCLRKFSYSNTTIYAHTAKVAPSSTLHHWLGHPGL
ncbi:hypothetical protein SADUNF_Sadunf19G0084100 [Salix dunnii]|uniref:Uncharacterized protein n=1 Tax=Salix dunnii TaxID=1413687 RepID=A0A835J667_9ROSI|nr:hypothetical protein SADUNF_Sadunf19G0084100 [Salix dunnii]